MINDNDHPPDRTLWLGDLEPWMDDHYMVEVCSLFGWDTSAIGRDPTPVDSAIEYSIFVGDIAADVTNADLMNVFRNPNLGLRGDFPPRLIAPFLSCCNAKVMVDSVTGISKGYGFVRFTSEADQKRALLEMQGLYCKSRPSRCCSS
ncbi:hypothetical protein M408DRAFT_82638 [Serendipita vermifera MAFF 305830]|uniref:RRM domain-containing protein n=1 Tax=Serendipita vermifera MAFF 305830 TaxID=933852 RepID=A0A0C3A5U3_SERVB|nr:hypothetical protein M408DRAFT_82638 [Serendipita vermifera MAFF 305830]